MRRLLHGVLAAALLTGQAGAVPTAWTTYSAAAAFSPVTNTYTISGTETIPNGAAQVVIEACGMGAGGGGGDTASYGGGGGGGGVGRVTKALTSVNWGQTLTVTVPASTAGGTSNANGIDGASVTVANNTYIGLGATLTATGVVNSGGKSVANGTAGGAAGTATGGAVNTAGSPGGAGGLSPGAFGAGATGVNCNGSNGTAGGTNTNKANVIGKVVFVYT